MLLTQQVHWRRFNNEHYASFINLIAHLENTMSTPIPFKDLLNIDGVIAAIRWRDSIPGRASASPPALVEAIGTIKPERAETLMGLAEATGLSIHGLSQLSHARALTDPTVVYPLDGYYVHSMRGSVACTINRVAVQLDNKVSVDIQALFGKMNLIDNRPKEK